MRQVLLRRTAALGTGATNICLDNRQTHTAGFDGFSTIVCPLTGTFRNLVTILDTPPGGVAARAFTLYKNGVATAMVSSHGSGQVNARDAVNTVAVVSGDRLRLVATVTGSPAVSDLCWTLEFDSSTDNESQYLTNIGTTQTNFLDPLTGRTAGTSVDCRRLIPCDGTITAMVGLNTSANVTAGNELNFFLYLNGVKQDGTGGTVDTKLSVTDVLMNVAVTRTFTLPVVRGDDIYCGIEEVGTYPSSWTAVSMVFAADVDGQSIVASMIAGNPSNSAVGYGILQGDALGAAVWGASIDAEDFLRCGVSTVTLHSLILEASDNPGAGNTRTFAVMRAGAVPAGAPGGVITNSALIIDDTASIEFEDGQVIGPMEHTPFSSPTVTGREWWSLVMGALDPEEVEPPEPTPGGTAPGGVNPSADAIPVGITRVFARMTYGIGSPQSEIKVAETSFYFDPPEWYGGYGHPWLISVSPITRELSDSLRGVEITIRVADTDRFFRTLATTGSIAGATWEVFLVSDTTRYALGVPMRRFAGHVHDHRALPNLEYEFVVRDVLSEELGRLADAPLIPPAKITPDLFPGATEAYTNRAIPIALGLVSDEDAVTPQGVVPPLIVAPVVNLQDAFGGLDVDVVAAIISHGALPLASFVEGYYNTVDDPYTRIPIPASTWGTLMTAPGKAGWAYTGIATDYVDYPLPLAANTYRYTPVFFLASDPNVQAVLDGRILVAFNVYGLTDEPDGSGDYFSDAPDVYEFLIRNYLYPPHWRTGAYNALPTLPDGYTVMNLDSVATSRTRLRAFGGGTYPVGFLLGGDGQQQTLRHVLNELAYGVLMEQGIDRHGRVLLDVEDPDAVPTLKLSDVLDIETGDFTTWVDRASYRNNAEFYFGQRYLPAVAPLPTPAEGETLPAAPLGPHQEWQSVGTYLHADAITANAGKLTPPMQLENRVVRNSDVAADWVERTIARYVGPDPSFDGQRLFRLTTSWQALEVELGDVIEIDHVDGFGTDGFEGQIARVLKITDDPQAARITLEGRLLFPAGS